jgi:hypothetical protein
VVLLVNMAVLAFIVLGQYKSISKKGFRVEDLIDLTKFPLSVYFASMSFISHVSYLLMKYLSQTCLDGTPGFGLIMTTF